MRLTLGVLRTRWNWIPTFGSSGPRRGSFLEGYRATETARGGTGAVTFGARSNSDLSLEKRRFKGAARQMSRRVWVCLRCVKPPDSVFDFQCYVWCFNTHMHLQTRSSRVGWRGWGGQMPVNRPLKKGFIDMYMWGTRCIYKCKTF